MADVPKDLLDQIKELEKLFTVDTAKLKEIRDHFVKELEKGKSGKAHRPLTWSPNTRSGLSKEGGSIVSSQARRRANPPTNRYDSR